MRRNISCFLIILSFIFLSSCSNESLSDIAKKGDWGSVKEKAFTEITDKGINKDNLYYAALSSYNTSSLKEAVYAARLYYLMYDKSNASILKILLYQGDEEESYNAGVSLYNSNSMNSSDKVQYFKVLNSKGLYSEANAILKEIKEVLPIYDYCFALINGNASSSYILDGLRMLYEEEGISNNFISFAEKSFNVFCNRDYYSLPEAFIRTTFDGNAQYALICGDFFFYFGEENRAKEYWSYARKLYPNAYNSRIEKL